MKSKTLTKRVPLIYTHTHNNKKYVHGFDTALMFGCVLGFVARDED